MIERYALWSHKGLTCDQTLTGTPDYLITTKSELGKTVLGKPIIAVVEAKQNNFTEEWGQCLAELAEVWQFGKLQEVTFTKHRTSLTIDDLPQLCGALIYCLKENS